MDPRHVQGLLMLAKREQEQQEAQKADSERLLGMLSMVPDILGKLKFAQQKVPVEEPLPDYMASGNVNTDNVTTIPLPSPNLDVSRIAEAIGKFESGGNYGSIGVPTRSGDRAYGKYQIMGANIPSWSREALGRVINTAEFLGNPQLQDIIAKYRMSQYLNKYRNAGDVASMWFSGRPMRNNISRDVLGTSVPQYVRAVNRYL